MTKIIKYINLIITLKEKYLNYYTKPITETAVNIINIFNIYKIKKIIRPFQIIYKNKIEYLEPRKLPENRNINIKIGNIVIRFNISDINL